MRQILKTAVLIAAFAPVMACGARRTSDYAPGAEVTKLDNVISVEVSTVRSLGHKIEVRWTFTNLANGAMHFRRDSVTMNYRGKTLAVHELLGGERDIDFRSTGQRKYKIYFFHAEERGTDITPGEYTVTFAGLMHGSGNTSSLNVSIKAP